MNDKGHVHCSICINAYPTKKEAEECFWKHTEIEKLRWIANRVHNIKIWQSETLNLDRIDYDLFRKIDEITEEYNISDNDY